MQKVCRAARNYAEKDECQYVAGNMVDNLNDCMRNGSPHAQTCARMLPGARAQLARANGDPVWVGTRQQRMQRQQTYAPPPNSNPSGLYGQQPAWANCTNYTMNVDGTKQCF